MPDGAGAGHYRLRNQPFFLPVNGSQSCWAALAILGQRAVELTGSSQDSPPSQHTHIHMHAHADTNRYSHTGTHMHSNQFLWSPK